MLKIEIIFDLFVCIIPIGTTIAASGRLNIDGTWSIPAMVLKKKEQFDPSFLRISPSNTESTVLLLLGVKQYAVAQSTRLYCGWTQHNTGSKLQ